MKQLSVIFFSVALSVCGFTQKASYDLSQYKLQDYEFRALDNTFLFSGNYRSGKSTRNGTPLNIETSNTNLHWQSIFRKLKNSREEQSDMYFSGEINYQRLASVGKSISNIYMNVFSDFDRKFFHQNEVFTGLGHRARLNVSRSNSGQIAYNTNVYLPFSVGIGRIENVTDAWQSVRILEDLRRFSVSKKTATDEEITKLAAFISKRQNLRFFDSRLKRIEDIETLDAFLKAEGLADDCNVRYFNSLFDQWLFGVNAMRRSGSSFAFKLSPYGILSAAPNQIGGVGFGGFLGLEYIKAKPLSLRHQLDLTGAIYAGGYVSGVPNPVTGLDGEKTIEPQASVSFGYFPTSRTSFSAKLSSVYKISDNQTLSGTLISPVVDDFERIYSLFHENGWRFIGEFSAKYYLTPQTRIEAGFNINYIQNNTGSSCGVSGGTNSRMPGRSVDCLHLNYHLQFSHSFF